MSLEFMQSLINEKMDGRPAYGFSSRLRAAVEKDEDTPSPLDYYADHYDSFGFGGRSFTFGGSSRFRRRSDISTGPCPGEYHMAEVKRKKDKSGRTTFGSRPGIWSINDDYVPGPQDYMPYDDHGSFYPKKGFSFGQRTQGRRISDIPGPGEYYTPKAFLFKDTPAYSFGMRNHHLERGDYERKATPSPMDYRPERANEFGSSSRGYLFGPGAHERTSFSKKDAEFEPGPGDYGVGVYRKTKCRQVNKKGFSFGQRFPTLIK